MERQRTPTLPERPQRGYWQFLYKYPSKYPGFGSISTRYGSGSIYYHAKKYQ
jgi:hypothetical protein